ncbi:MAG: thioredoxin family protein [Gemmatimonadetes bacterium]|nr:thioredoxin family protein [Gemmatimonadota bacterium]
MNQIVAAGAVAALVFAGTATAAPHKKGEAAHAVDKNAPAEMHAAAVVGQPAPDFTLTDTDGNEVRLSDYSDKTVVLEWFNPDCPFVKKHHQKNKTMQSLYSEWKGDDVVWLAINSGAPGKQGHGVERNQKAKKDYGIEYPILIDENGIVGRMYGAKTTPDMFVIQKGTLVYSGAIDDNRSTDELGKTNYVADALTACTAGKTVATGETKSYGCSVKYGEAPL